MVPSQFFVGRNLVAPKFSEDRNSVLFHFYLGRNLDENHTMGRNLPAAVK